LHFDAVFGRNDYSRSTSSRNQHDLHGDRLEQLDDEGLVVSAIHARSQRKASTTCRVRSPVSSAATRRWTGWRRR
jgi:hypothetical protein